MRHPYPNFVAALEQLARTDRERAELLGVTRRMVIDYKNGKSLPHVRIVKRFAALDDALTLDLRPQVAAKPISQGS